MISGKNVAPHWYHDIDDPTDWRCIVAAAAYATDTIVDAVPCRMKLIDLIDEHTRACTCGLRTRHCGVDWAGEVNGYGTELFDAAVLLGFALARTWPTSLEAMNDWPRRALELAGLLDEQTTVAESPAT